MLFSRQLVVFLFYFVLPCHALRCTTNCSFKYNLTEPFNIPDRCNQIVSAGRCIAYLEFSYDTQTYNVRFEDSQSSSISSGDNRRFVFLNLLSMTSPLFSYLISYACKNKDDCTRDLARNGVNEILQRQVKMQEIVNELKPLISSDSVSSNNSNLTCYDSNDNIFQCGTLANPALCVVEHIIKRNSMNRSCTTKMKPHEVYVSMYQSNDDYATFDVGCNRSLCNTQTTLQSVKNVMFKYNVTVTLDGHLVENGSVINYGSKLMISVLFIIMVNFHLLSN